MEGSKPPSTPSSFSADINPPKYVPQFSASTEMILQRMKSGTATSLTSIGITATPPGYEDMRRSVLQGMKTTLNMELPSPPNAGVTPGRGRPRKNENPGGSGRSSGKPTPSSSSNSRRGRGSGKLRGAKSGIKRKRAMEESESSEDSGELSGLGGESESDDTSGQTELPKMTQSGRTVVKPSHFIPAPSEVSTSRKRGPNKRNQDNALCKRCSRGHSPMTNQIVFCDGCNLGWHQKCHDPVILDGVVQDESIAWFCADCGRKKKIKSEKVEPYKDEPVRVITLAEKSVEERRSYFNSLPQTQLVSYLLQAVDQHPNLLFSLSPSNFQQSSLSQPRAGVFQQQLSSTSMTASTGGAGHQEGVSNILNNYMRSLSSTEQGVLFQDSQVASNSYSSAAMGIVSQVDPALHSSTHHGTAPHTIFVAKQGEPEPEEDAEGSRESTPASPPYPKPGHGLMSKLGPDDEDLDWLVDSADFGVFSHTVYDESGSKVEENGVAVNINSGENPLNMKS